jgi:hypothetical protein
MPSLEGSNLRPLWRFRHASNQQIVTSGTPPPQKDVKNEGRSGKVYENKGSQDKMPDAISDMGARLRPVLQKIVDLEDSFCQIWRLQDTSWGNFRGTMPALSREEKGECWKSEL